MHGVSDSFAKQAFTTFGFPPYVPVIEQQFPDPEFPTVRFPNPEEKGALDLALRTAENERADYILAQDPDGDRFIAAERGPTGSWTIFTGDQLGSLFADKILQSYKSSGARPVEKLAMVASTVSSKMLGAIAETEGFRFVECLTGFKFIGNTALALVEEDFEVPFGYEEAIGFMFGSDIRDKDGIAAMISRCRLRSLLSLSVPMARPSMSVFKNYIPIMVISRQTIATSFAMIPRSLTISFHIFGTIGRQQVLTGSILRPWQVLKSQG